MKIMKKQKNEGYMKVGFDACWSHRREPNHCLGILQDLITQLIIAFHIVHHGPKMNETMSSTNKHAKCMEKIAHDCDLLTTVYSFIYIVTNNCSFDSIDVKLYH